MITGGDLRQSRLDVGYKTFTISPWGLTACGGDGDSTNAASYDFTVTAM